MANWQRAVMKAMRIKNYPVSVKSLQDITPSYRRITFYAPEAVDALEGYPTEWVRIWVPELGAADSRIVQRGYTVTGLRKEAGEFDLEFVLHEIPGSAGDWAKRVRPGAEAEISLTPSRPKIPADCEHLILAGDLTALPAINSWLRFTGELDVGRISILVEDVHGPEHQLPREASAIALEWLWVQPASVRGVALCAEVDKLLGDGAKSYVWGAGEKELVKRLRGSVRGNGLPKESYFTQFYWIFGKNFA